MLFEDNSERAILPFRPVRSTVNPPDTFFVLALARICSRYQMVQREVDSADKLLNPG